MTNAKLAQRHRLILEFGILLCPLRELRDRDSPPTLQDYRIAIAKVRSADARWREKAREFTTFAPDLWYAQEFNDITHVPERLWRKVTEDLLGRLSHLGQIHSAFINAFDAAIERFLDYVVVVPIDAHSVTFIAHTPFSAYLAVLESLTPVRRRLHYFDRYLKPEFYDLFLRVVPRDVEVRLVTTTTGVQAVSAVSALAAKEFADYKLLELSPKEFHDRTLRTDDRVFSLGTGTDQLGFKLSHFGPAGDAPEAHAEHDALIAKATVVHRSEPRESRTGVTGFEPA